MKIPLWQLQAGATVIFRGLICGVNGWVWGGWDKEVCWKGKVMRDTMMKRMRIVLFFLSVSLLFWWLGALIRCWRRLVVIMINKHLMKISSVKAMLRRSKWAQGKKYEKQINSVSEKKLHPSGHTMWNKLNVGWTRTSHSSSLDIQNIQTPDFLAICDILQPQLSGGSDFVQQDNFVLCGIWWHQFTYIIKSSYRLNG